MIGCITRIPLLDVREATFESMVLTMNRLESALKPYIMNV
jgi:hypothetical protein